LKANAGQRDDGCGPCRERGKLCGVHQLFFFAVLALEVPEWGKRNSASKACSSDTGAGSGP
jgi:hypothetical protein